mmetsp:Transcript_56532/g.163900  ORF Transcript_56532/g.163900 Transcript_56532/m.163900 type:complete len:111 (+) Transcript_56532:31-363(+)
MPTNRERHVKLFVSCSLEVPTMTNSFNITKRILKMVPWKQSWYQPMKPGRVGSCNSIVQHPTLAKPSFVDIHEMPEVVSFQDCRKIDPWMNQVLMGLEFGLHKVVRPMMI